MPAHFWADALRTAVVALFALQTGQILGTIYFYLHAIRIARSHGVKSRGLLPTHVLSVSVAFEALSVEAVAFTLGHVGGALHFWSWFNLVVFALSNYALWVVMRFERRRVVEYAPVLAVHLPNETLILDSTDEHKHHHRGSKPRGGWEREF